MSRVLLVLKGKQHPQCASACKLHSISGLLRRTSCRHIQCSMLPTTGGIGKHMFRNLTSATEACCCHHERMLLGWVCISSFERLCSRWLECTAKLLCPPNTCALSLQLQCFCNKTACQWIRSIIVEPSSDGCSFVVSLFIYIVGRC